MDEQWEKIIPGSRLDLVSQLKEHAPDMYRVLNDERLYEFTGEHVPQSVEWLAERYAKLEDRTSPNGDQLWLNWVVRQHSTGLLIGFVQATVVDGSADIAWLIGCDWQMRGYASEAAELMLRHLTHMGISHFTCSIAPGHHGSEGVASNLGMMRINRWEGEEEIWQIGFQ